MDIQSILAEYDSMLGKSSEKELSDFLSGHLKEAEAAGDKGTMSALNNELVGITRRTGDLKAAMKACANVSHLMNELGLTRTREYAVALINMATTYRVYGLLDEGPVPGISEIQKPDAGEAAFRIRGIQTSGG